MIIGMLKDIRRYESVLPNLANGLNAIENRMSDEPGRYPFEGGYYMIQQGTTKPMEEGTFEAHRKYIDVQILLEGEEEIAWQTLEETVNVIAYDEIGDKERRSGSHEINCLIKAGMFWAAYPEDAHQALSHTEIPHHYRKIVMKLPISKED